jgi:hypothetical protein
MRAWFVQLFIALLVFTQQGWSQPTNLPDELKWRVRATNGSVWSAVANPRKENTECDQTRKGRSTTSEAGKLL